MRIGNIKICKNVVKGFCVGTGLGLLTGGLVSYFHMKRQICDVIDYYEGYIEEDKVNPLQESDDKKREIYNHLLNGGSYRTTSMNKKDNGVYVTFEKEEDVAIRTNNTGHDILFDVNPAYPTNLIEYEKVKDLKERLEEGVTPEDGDPKPIDEEEEQMLMNIFDTVDEDEEDSKRISKELHDGNPYTITREQFLGSCMDFTKTTIGYYTENAMLVDEEGDPVSEGDAIAIIGEHGLKKFGQDSGDDDTVYLRNPWIHTDIELVRYWEEYDISMSR